MDESLVLLEAHEDFIETFCVVGTTTLRFFFRASSSVICFFSALLYCIFSLFAWMRVANLFDIVCTTFSYLMVRGVWNRYTPVRWNTTAGNTDAGRT